MFYHNHRRFKAGKRKGKTPYEILTGRSQTKDWLDLLIETYEEKRALKIINQWSEHLTHVNLSRYCIKNHA